MQSPQTSIMPVNSRKTMLSNSLGADSQVLTYTISPSTIPRSQRYGRTGGRSLVPEARAAESSVNPADGGRGILAFNEIPTKAKFLVPDCTWEGMQVPILSPGTRSSPVQNRGGRRRRGTEWDLYCLLTDRLLRSQCISYRDQQPKWD